MFNPPSIHLNHYLVMIAEVIKQAYQDFPCWQHILKDVFESQY
jgi:hypothetical protein